ncbi:MAG: M28 family peptidase [Phycisphaeraceae bacterium]|nr:M28 family peptidase [Phycisphaerales bacterium]MCB9843943.1 M28 family peptidase [Phycisphaeraceae bacterium]
MSRRWMMPLSAALIACAGCASGSVATDSGARQSTVRSDSSAASSSEWVATTTERDDSVAAAATPSAAPASALTGRLDYGIADELRQGDSDLTYYTQTVMTLSDPFFEGRSADTRGMALAQEFLEFHMRDIGLEPAFAQREISPGGAETAALEAFGQDFTVNGPLAVNRAVASYKGDAGTVALVEGEDFEPMGFSATKSVTGPLAFIGYSIEEGQDGYSSFAEGDDLTGRIAVMLRYEPMDGAGGSKWSGRGWSGAASLANKVKAAADRGAAGVILVNPPMLDVADINALQSPSRSRFDVDGDLPVIQMTPKAANPLVKLADTEGRNLASLQALADESGGVIMFDDSVTATIDVDLERKKLPTANVGGILRGKGALADEWIIIGAHYDHVGYGHLAGARRSNVGRLHPGADDNASGTAGVLVLGKRLKEQYDAMGAGDNARSILFLCFAGEEMGLLGSKHFVENNDMDPAKVQAMLNMDMIGRLTDGALEINGTGTANEWDEILDPFIASSGMVVNKTVRTGGRSDHANFAEWGCPSVHFFTGTHNDYHQPSDTADTMNYEGAMRVLDMVEGVAMKTATMRARLTREGAPEGTQAAAAAEPERPTRMAFKVRLGIRPENYEGGEPGVLVGDVFPGTSAADGGMLKGDRIIRWDGHDLADVSGMMERLGSHNPGDVARIVVVRDGKEVELNVPMKAPEGAN